MRQEPYAAVARAVDYRLRMVQAAARIRQALIRPEQADALLADALDALEGGAPARQAYRKQPGAHAILMMPDYGVADGCPWTHPQVELLLVLANDKTLRQAAVVLGISEQAAKSRLKFAGKAVGAPGDQLLLIAMLARSPWVQTGLMPERCPLSARHLDGLALLAEGMTLDDAAVKLDVPRDTLKSRIARARHLAGCKTVNGLVAKAVVGRWIA